MKLILLVIFIIIYFNAISSKTLKIKDIYKRSNSHKHYPRQETKIRSIGPPTLRKSNSNSHSKQQSKKSKF